MRTLFPALALALGLWLCSLAPASAQLQNAGFETQYPGKAPSNFKNILLLGNTSTTALDELPNWRSFGSGADYLATNATNPDVNPATYAAPYNIPLRTNSQGYVQLQREVYSFQHDQFITQQVTLLPNHRYQAGFWTLRRYGYAERMSLTVTTQTPLYDTSPTSARPPYGRITSSPIHSTNTWTQVSGYFVTPPSTNTTISSYITIGYDRSNGEYDAAGVSPDEYVIDDVSLVDLGCNTPAAPILTQVDVQGDDCYNVAHFSIDNFDSTTGTTYSFTKIANNPAVLWWYSTGHFIVKISGPSSWPASATFTITTKNSCGATATSAQTVANYYCVGIQSARTTSTSPTLTASPNPVSESLALPQGVTHATLLNSYGKPMQLPNTSGRLDVRALPAGLYNLQMEQNGKTTNQRIEVKH